MAYRRERKKRAKMTNGMEKKKRKILVGLEREKQRIEMTNTASATRRNAGCSYSGVFIFKDGYFPVAVITRNLGLEFFFFQRQLCTSPIPGQITPPYRMETPVFCFFFVFFLNAARRRAAGLRSRAAER